MSADEQIIEVVDKLLVTRFDPRDGEIIGGPAVYSAQLTQFLASKPAQAARALRLIGHLLQSFPVFLPSLNQIVAHQNFWYKKCL